jgi:hypothetical protein
MIEDDNHRTLNDDADNNVQIYCVLMIERQGMVVAEQFSNDTEDKKKTDIGCPSRSDDDARQRILCAVSAVV